MINRQAKEALLRLASQFPVVGLTGPRQSGKTTLANAVFPDKRYITLDDQDMRSIAEANPLDFVRALPGGAIIDEAQKVPALFDALKLHVDSSPWTPGKFILTGSSQFRLKQNMSDSMAGRAVFINLFPLSTTELADAHMLSDSAYELMFKGLYPPLHDPEKHFVAADWFEGYVDTYISRDVSGLVNVGNLSTFKRFVQVCATYSGQLLSMEGIARDVGVSAPTIKSWLSILESSYIIHFLEPDSNNLGKSVVKTPKLYFVDTGLLCYFLRLETVEDLLLSRYKGAVVETFAVSELLKSRSNQGKKPHLTFFRDHSGFEVDVIADWKHSFAIEVKSTSGIDAKLSSNTRKYIEWRKDCEVSGVVFYLGDLTLDVNGILYVGWHDWGKFMNT